MSLLEKVKKTDAPQLGLDPNTSNLEAFKVGIKALFFGFRLSFQPEIRHYVIIPLLINSIIFIGGSILLYSWIQGSLMASFIGLVPSELPAFLSWLDPIIGWLMSLVQSIIWLALIFALLFIVANTFTAVAHSIAAPFNAFLSEKVEKLERPIKYPEFSLKEIVIRSIQREVSRLIYWLPKVVILFICCFIISFVPLVNIIAPCLWAFFGAWMICMQYLDYASDNKGLEIKDTLAKMKKHRMCALGFGSATLVITLIPIINWFAISSAVVGATLLWVYVFDRDQP